MQAPKSAEPIKQTHIYILSSDGGDTCHKLGVHTGTREKLHNRYQTYHENPVIKVFRPIENAKEIEKRCHEALRKTGRASYHATSKRPSERYLMSIKEILEIVNPILDGKIESLKTSPKTSPKISKKSDYITNEAIINEWTKTKLADLCVQYGIPKSGTKDELIARILNYEKGRDGANIINKRMEKLMELTRDELLIRCVKHGLNINGTKKDLVDNILNYKDGKSCGNKYVYNGFHTYAQLYTLTKSQLLQICYQLKQPVNDKFTIADLVVIIYPSQTIDRETLTHDTLSAYTCDELREICQLLDMDTTGKKDELIAKLLPPSKCDTTIGETDNKSHLYYTIYMLQAMTSDELFQIAKEYKIDTKIYQRDDIIQTIFKEQPIASSENITIEYLDKILQSCSKYSDLWDICNTLGIDTSGPANTKRNRIIKKLNLSATHKTVRKGIVSDDYIASSPDELTVKKDDIVELLDTTDIWWYIRIGDREGRVPELYVTISS